MSLKKHSHTLLLLESIRLRKIYQAVPFILYRSNCRRLCHFLLLEYLVCDIAYTSYCSCSQNIRAATEMAVTAEAAAFLGYGDIVQHLSHKC